MPQLSTIPYSHVYLYFFICFFFFYLIFLKYFFPKLIQSLKVQSKDLLYITYCLLHINIYI